MFGANLRKCYSKRVFFLLSRHPERFSQNFTSAQSNLDLNQDKVPQNENNIKLVTTVKTDELSFSPPKPFDEIPECSDNAEYHPAEFIDSIGPPLPVSFNLAAYVNHSETLTKLVELGVDLSEMDKNPEKARFILKLDFEKHVKNHIQFLHDNGVESDELGRFITRNPFIFQEDLENLEIRINYLKSKRFSEDSIARIITRNPLFLSLPTKTVDSRLGFFQKQFFLTGDEVRHIVTRCPKLITYDHMKFMEKIFIIKELNGFASSDLKKILIEKPKIWMLGARALKERLDVVLNVMKMPHERIVEFPGVLLRRTFMLKDRHAYLVHLNRDQYDPTKPNFVSLQDISTTVDTEFCQRCAKTSVDQYNEFLKSR